MAETDSGSGSGNGNGSEDVRGRTQQSALASQRAKEQGQQMGRFAQWFPLGAKEGFSQWVRGALATVSTSRTGRLT
jgi:cardiolipin-specific phospholipase